MEHQIQSWHQTAELSRKLEKIPGIGPVTANAFQISRIDRANQRDQSVMASISAKKRSRRVGFYVASAFCKFRFGKLVCAIGV